MHTFCINTCCIASHEIRPFCELDDAIEPPTIAYMQETWRDRAKRAMEGRITQDALAERLNMTQGGLGHWLNGRRQPALEDINRIADEIGVSRIWLTHGVGYERGPGKRLIDVLMSDTLGDGDLEALAITAEQLAAARSNLQKALGANPDSLLTTDQLKKDTTDTRDQ